mmetsp:Transcript_16251/g.23930  ORF Transcript_16251/g.23930 Transcript_16251/m.23930 type:complete len:352 (-) Transcript_16251:146-1201(-)|eukprot:CAMPEP_0116021692 /NCGR_PEP_ID=MMETSP0321-20121206/10545_1 /TAXON_ID=163516 /ORGANISM="Leptocylindrus danicus var. danicus, Strain B650" /LENGTH=351 /DNA_ID=CAMNT_0003492625 /DNA_START=152 /DNA_END=1207 /DNA_ORIENTATION=-
MSAPEGTRITLIKPDDFHHHFRDGPKTASIVAHAKQRFARCLAMPNLKPPVTTTEMAEAYHEHIIGDSTTGNKLDLIMTLYLTDRTTSEEIRKAWSSTKANIKAVKFYPAGATTNSEFGVTDVTLVYPALRTMAELGMVLCIHSEVSTPSVDIFDREAVFIEEVMKPLVAAIPNLKIVMEHISTETAVQYVQSAPDNVAASITCHHLLYNRNALLVGGIKPHFYCLPILKRELHREALIAAATSGNKKFFLGTDSAPHTKMMKETGCGCAGVYTAHAALELYAEAFDRMGKLENLEAFCSHHGADHYGLPRNEGTITLVKKEWTVPRTYDLGGKDLQPLRAGETVAWSIEE